MTARVAFDVAGIPVPQGSMSAFVRGGHAVVTHQHGGSLGAWRTAIAQEARAASGELLEGALAVRIAFRLPRPASHTGKRGLLPSAPAHPTTRPDIDKLVRSALDALTGVVFADDSQVSLLRVTKDYAAPGCQPGAAFEITERLA